MRQEDVVDTLRRHASLRERREHSRHCRCGRAIDDHGPAVLDDEMDRRLHLAVVDRVHRHNAVRVVKDTLHRRIIESAP